VAESSAEAMDSCSEAGGDDSGDSDDSSDSDATTSPAPTVWWYTDSDTDTDSSTDFGDFSITGVLVALLAAVVAGSMFGCLWLQCIRTFPASIIKIMLVVQITAWVIVAIVGIAADIMALCIIALLIAAIYGLYTWCVWKRIPFAGVCLSIATAIIQQYTALIGLSFVAVFFAFIWYILWWFTIIGYVLSADEFSNVVYFLLLISLYWGANVCMNVSHTTTCGVAATWYFSKEAVPNPSAKAFKRTMTSSFGSVALGSLIVAILQAMRSMLRSQKRGCLVCIAICLLKCIERLMHYFNTYAFAQVAIYGVSFVEAGKRTWDLFVSKGILAVINDDLSGLALTCGCMLGMIVGAGAAVGVSVAFYGDEDYGILMHILCGIVGAYLAFAVVGIILRSVSSGVVAIFVCFAEDPAAGKNNRPEDYQRLVDTNVALMEAARTAGLEPQPVVVDGMQQAQTGQPQQVPPQTQVVYVQAQPQPVQGQPQVVYVQGQPPVQQPPPQ